ncbi:MAG TPA: CoA transferase [Thermoleophilaceae bacterium]|nr:CoA transferase [Thermoleophilaceae bacterium]
MSDAPLGDLLVLDFSRVLAAPLATMLLADHGATVLKVERPGRGDDTRGWGPPHAADGSATYFLSVNRGKHSVALDLGDEADLAVARELAAGADVLVENFRPGVMERLGMDYDSLAGANPGLVYCTVTGFGSGAGAKMPGYDLLLQAVGGLMSVTGSPDGEPQKVGVALVDVITGLFATAGILTALRHRDRTGQGQAMELNLLTCLLAALVNQSTAQTAAGVTPGRMGNAHPSIAPYETFATAEGTLVVAVGTDHQFTLLCELVGAAGLAADPRFATNTDRVANRVELREALAARLVTAPAAEWAPRLLEAGVPAGEVNDIAAALELAEQLGLAPTVTLPGPGGADVTLPANPIGMSGTPPRYGAGPPALGSLSAEEALALVRRP